MLSHFVIDFILNRLYSLPYFQLILYFSFLGAGMAGAGSGLGSQMSAALAESNYAFPSGSTALLGHNSYLFSLTYLVPFCTVLYSTLIYSTVASSPIHCTPYSSTTSPDLHVPHPHWLQIYLISSQISYCTVLSCTTDKIMWNTTQLTSYQTLSSTTMSHLVITYVHYRLPL